MCVRDSDSAPVGLAREARWGVLVIRVVNYTQWNSGSGCLYQESLNTRGVADGGGGMHKSVGGFDTSRQAHDVAAYFL